MWAYVINSNASSNNLSCYPPDSQQSRNAVYRRTGGDTSSDNFTYAQGPHAMYKNFLVF